jgi:hypothetical protein
VEESSELQTLRGRVMHVLGDVQALANHLNTLEGCSPIDRRPVPVKSLRTQRGWPAARVAAELERAAIDCGVRLPDRKTLRCMVIGWEGGLAPDPFYRELLRIVFAPSEEKKAA